MLFLKLANYIDLQAFCDEENFESNEKIIADIACDHGYIGLKAYNEGLASKVIFSDVSSKSLEKAVKLTQNHDKIADFEFCVGDGISILDCHVFTSIIAGIGGREIFKILENKEKLSLSKYYILQTRQDDVFLRENIERLGLYVCADKMVKDGEFVYHTLLVSKINIYNVDDIVFEYFKSIGIVPSQLSENEIDGYKKFHSKYFGKNNFFVNTLEHKNMIAWLINRYKSMLDELLIKDKLSDGLLTFQNELKDKLMVLDKMDKGAL